MKQVLVILFISIMSGYGFAAESASVTPQLAIYAASHAAAAGLVERTVKGSEQKVFVHAEALLTNRDIKHAEFLHEKDGVSTVEVVFTKAGKKKFAQATADSIDQPLAIMLNDEVISAPIVREKIKGGRAHISGIFTRAEAQRLAQGLTPKK